LGGCSKSTLFLDCFPDAAFCSLLWLLHFGWPKRDPERRYTFSRDRLKIRPYRPKAPKVVQSPAPDLQRVPESHRNGAQGHKIDPPGSQTEAKRPRRAASGDNHIQANTQRDQIVSLPSPQAKCNLCEHYSGKASVTVSVASELNIQVIADRSCETIPRPMWSSYL